MMLPDDHQFIEAAPKRRRISTLQGSTPSSIGIPSDTAAFSHDAGLIGFTDGPNQDSKTYNDGSISILATSEQAGQNVAPFLAKHIPTQYAPLGGTHQPKTEETKKPNTKYCYRHRPDLKCRRKVNEPSMDQLQHELEALSQADQQGIAHVWSLFSAAPSKQRNLMLQGILAQCCFSQLSYLSANLEDLIRIDFLTLLPVEISFKILCYLDTTSLCKAAQVSQKWRTLADDDVVWHRMCEQHIDRKCTKCGWGLPLLERKRLRASKRQIQLRATGRGLNVWSPNITPFPESAPDSSDPDLDARSSSSSKYFFEGKDKRASPGANDPARALESTKKRSLVLSEKTDVDSYFQARFRPWKDVYKDRFKVGTNWKHGRYSTKIFRGHTNGVMCLQFDENILVTGSYDATIKIWDIETGRELRTLRGHEQGIRCLSFDDTKLISGSLDSTLKVWNWRTGECISTYTGHSGGVICLHFDYPILASGSTDKTIKIWNFEDKSTFLLRGHTDWVNAVKVDFASRTIFSASDDCTVRLWDLDNKSCIKTFEGHVGQVQQVLPLPHEFDYEETDLDHDHDGSSSPPSSLDQPAVTANPASLSLSDSFGPGFLDSTRPLPARYMLTGSLDSTIRLWDTATKKCLRTYFGHVEGIWALAADTLRVVSGAEDRMVKVWDARSGKCERTFMGHTGAVTCVGLSDNRMCTGSEDSEVRMYSF